MALHESKQLRNTDGQAGGDALDVEQGHVPAAALDVAQVRPMNASPFGEDFLKREEASKRLVEIGPAALKLLEAAATDADPEVAARATVCIQRVEDIQAIPALVEKLGSDEDYRRAAASMELTRIGRPAVS